MRRALAFSIVLKAALSASGASAETLKVAVAQRGFWNSSFIEFGIKQGFFKETGLDIDILYTEGGASTLTPVIAGSIDIAMTNGTLGAIAAYAKGMPVKIISAEATGAAEAFWYARPESGIKRLADTAGKTVAFSSPGSSTNLILLQLINQAKVAPKLVSAEPMELGGWAKARRHGHPSSIIGGNDKRGDNRNQNHRDHQRCAEEPFGGEEAPHLFLRKPDSRIEDHVEQIDREIGEHDDGCDDENRGLDQGNVAVEQSLVGQPAHAGVVEQRLDDDDRAKEVTNLKAGHRDRRADRVGQRVTPND